jgi:transcriptional regulator with XRE-family HTH domain
MIQGRWTTRRPNPVFGEDYQAIRQVLVQARRDCGLSQAKLAERLGKCKSHIARIERGQRRLDTLELYLISRCLGLSPAALFARMTERLDRRRPERDPFAEPPAQGAP